MSRRECTEDGIYEMNVPVQRDLVLPRERDHFTEPLFGDFMSSSTLAWTQRAALPIRFQVRRCCCMKVS